MTDDGIQPHGVKPESNGLGLAGFIVSLVGIASCGLLSPIGLILSFIAVFRQPRGFAIAGLVLGLLGSIWTLVLIAGVGIAMIGAIVGGLIAGRGPLEATFDGWVMEETIERYVETNGALPATIDDVAGELDSGVLQDRWGRPYRIEINHESQRLIVMSDGPDGVADTDDDIRLTFDLD